MTDEERYAYNQKLMDAVPEIQMGDSHAWTMYRG